MELTVRWKDAAFMTQALSACRAFNYELYDSLATELMRDPKTAQKFPIDVRDFAALTTRLSFVLPFGERGDDWYQIHSVLRRIWQRRFGNDLRIVHEVLARYFEKHHRETDNPIWCAEAIFHLNRLDPIHGIREWIKRFRIAVDDESDFSLCEALRGIRDELNVQSDFQEAQILYLVAMYRSAFARYDEARELFNAAIAKFDAADKQAPDDVEIKSDKAEALIAFGELRLEQAEYSEAKKNFEDALSSCEHALRLKSDHIEANYNKGAALVSMADIYSELGEESKAVAHYRQAIAALDQTVQLNSEHCDSYNGKGYALASIGEIETEQDRFLEAADEAT